MKLWLWMSEKRNVSVCSGHELANALFWLTLRGKGGGKYIILFLLNWSLGVVSRTKKLEASCFFKTEPLPTQGRIKYYFSNTFCMLWKRFLPWGRLCTICASNPNCHGRLILKVQSFGLSVCSECALLRFFFLISVEHRCEFHCSGVACWWKYCTTKILHRISDQVSARGSDFC